MSWLLGCLGYSIRTWLVQRLQERKSRYRQSSNRHRNTFPKSSLERKPWLIFHNLLNHCSYTPRTDCFPCILIRNSWSLGRAMTASTHRYQWSWCPCTLALLRRTPPGRRDAGLRPLQWLSARLSGGYSGAQTSKVEHLSASGFQWWPRTHPYPAWTRVCRRRIWSCPRSHPLSWSLDKIRMHC